MEIVTIQSNYNAYLKGTNYRKANKIYYETHRGIKKHYYKTLDNEEVFYPVDCIEIKL